MKHIIWPLILVTTASALIIRLILVSGWRTSTLLYIIVPFVISVVLYILLKKAKGKDRNWGYPKHLLVSTIIFLATSGLLMEGFICVLIFMPIYYFFITIGYAFLWGATRPSKNKDGRMKVYILPALVLVLASEGLHPFTTPSRDQSATYVTLTNQSVAKLKENMAAPIVFPDERNWFLRLFPIPNQVNAGTLVAGDVHNLHFTYRKWVFGNDHHGNMDIRIVAVEPLHIQTEILHDSSYFSHYVKVYGTDVYFTPMANGQTQISLTVKYKRLLDPSWYFGPMQDYATKQSAKYLVENIIVRESNPL